MNTKYYFVGLISLCFIVNSAYCKTVLIPKGHKAAASTPRTFFIFSEILDEVFGSFLYEDDNNIHGPAITIGNHNHSHNHHNKNGNDVAENLAVANIKQYFPHDSSLTPFITYFITYLLNNIIFDNYFGSTYNNDYDNDYNNYDNYDDEYSEDGDDEYDNDYNSINRRIAKRNN